MYILTVNYSPDRTDEVVAMLEAEPRVSNVLVVQGMGLIKPEQPEKKDSEAG